MQILVQSEFINSKLTAKANRQLQDPLVIMTGHLPRWLPDLMSSCPFLFPFETRLMYFYMSSLDRDRAMQKLIDLNGDLMTNSWQQDSNSQNERIVPKLDRKKKTISRSGDLIKQADLILTEFSLNSANKSGVVSASSSGLAAISTSSFLSSLASASSSSSSSTSKHPLLEIQYENEVWHF